VIDHEIDRNQRVDLRWIAAERLIASRHRGEIDHRGHAVKSCISTAPDENAISRSDDLVFSHCATPLDVLFGDGAAVFVPQKIFQQEPSSRMEDGKISRNPCFSLR